MSSKSNIHPRRRHKSPEPRSLAKFSSAALSNNYQQILKQVPDQKILPMIKADAYGHGIGWVCQTLKKKKNLYGFGAATFAEAIEAREALKSSRIPVFLFSGTSPWLEQYGKLCEKYHLTPSINTSEDWRRFKSQGWAKKLSYHLKFNTGMNRLGLPMERLPEMIRFFSKNPKLLPSGVYSHLAEGEATRSPLSQKQRKHFQEVHRSFRSLNPSIDFHLANSSGIWNHSHWKLAQTTTAVRPGLSLYGIRPWPGAQKRGVRPVLTFVSRVVAIQKLQKGERVGYGGRFRVPKGSPRHPFHVAVLGVGYEDGVMRHLSQKGQVWLNGKKRMILGNVSMDLTSVEADSQVRVGQWAEIIGNQIDLWQQSQLAGMIPYEFMTSISSRVERKYV